jgi:hypothetical protein
MYRLIAVSTTPTKAALEMGWPETVISIATSVFALSQWRRARVDGKPSSYRVVSNVCIPIVVGTAWTISFGFIEHDKATGEWISVLTWTVTGLVAFWAIENNFSMITAFFVFIAIFQFCGSVDVVVQRWNAEVGTVAYFITDNGGCEPYNGFAYLEQGARSKAFRIIQTAEIANSFIGFFVFVCLTPFGVRRPMRKPDGSRQRHVNSHEISKWFLGGYFLLIYIPVLVYEIIIATKGRPVVITGNCMLVELDPKYGFLDSEIENWWKALVSISGL